MLGVGAIGENGAPANFSSDNLSVQVAAPGISVPAQGKDGEYWLVSGTSPACALTAGVAALIRAAYPALTPVLVRKAITSTTSNRPPGAGGWDDQVGFGTVDAAAALAAAARLAAQPSTGPGARPGLRKPDAAAPGVSAASHFGDGPAAIPPAPIAPRGLRPLAVFCLLAALCLAMIVDRHEPGHPDAQAAAGRGLARRAAAAGRVRARAAGRRRVAAGERRRRGPPAGIAAVPVVAGAARPSRAAA